MFVTLDDQNNKGVCMIKDDNLHCFKVNDFENQQKYIFEVFKDGQCLAYAPVTSCDDSDGVFHGSIYVDGTVDIYDSTSNKRVTVYPDNSVRVY